jgi:hypothetical protein
MTNGFSTNWQMSADIQDNILYQKWSNKTLGQVIASKATLAADIGAIFPNKDNVYILAYLMWLCRNVKDISNLS